MLVRIWVVVVCLFFVLVSVVFWVFGWVFFVFWWWEFFGIVGDFGVVVGWRDLGEIERVVCGLCDELLVRGLIVC